MGTPGALPAGLPGSGLRGAGTWTMHRTRDSTLKHSVTLGLQPCSETMAIWPIWLAQLPTWGGGRGGKAGSWAAAGEAPTALRPCRK